MGKSRKRAVPYAKEHTGHARASVAGPALLAALKPVAARLVANGGAVIKPCDTVGVYLTGDEAAAILAAVDVAENGVT